MVDSSAISVSDAPTRQTSDSLEDAPPGVLFSVMGDAASNYRRGFFARRAAGRRGGRGCASCSPATLSRWPCLRQGGHRADRLLAASLGLSAITDEVG